MKSRHNPHSPEGEVVTEDGVVIGNVYNKYESKNPIARHLLAQFFSNFDELLRISAATEVHEVGCGEGYLCSRIHARGCKVRGSDFSKQILTKAKSIQGDLIPFSERSIYELDPRTDSAELIVCCEVLEHLDNPHEALASLSKVTRDWFIASVPREPLWSCLNMARGRYWGDLGNTPGHVQRWSSRAFSQLIEGYFDIVELRQPLPWTMVLCRPKEQ